MAVIVTEMALAVRLFYNWPRLRVLNSAMDRLLVILGNHIQHFTPYTALYIREL